MNRRLAGISFAAAIAVIAGCSSSPSNKKIALQIEPNHQQEQPLADGVNPKPRLSEPEAPAGPVTPAFLPPAPDAAQAQRQTATYAKLLENATAHHPATQPSAPDAPFVPTVDPSQLHIGPSNANSDHLAVKPPAAADAQSPIRVAPPEANAGASIEGAKSQDSSNTALASLEPVESKASAVFSPSGDSFETRITRRLKDYPRDISANLDYQLLLFLRDEPVPQLSSITSLPTEDRELISSVMDGLSNFRSTLRADNNMLFSHKIHPLTDMTDRLRTQAELSIPALALCTKVDGFGRYEPIDPPRFPAQREAAAIIYCELENFSSQQNQAKMWQTDITQEAVLYTEDGMQVWADKTQRIQDTCRDRRHDFFLRTLVRFPGTLTVGRYMLKVTIVDSQANRVAEASLPIEVAGQ